jgi:hypothetical protein
MQISQISYTFVLRAEIATIFGPKMVYKAMFSVFYNISQPNFAILLILVCSF